MKTLADTMATMLETPVSKGELESNPSGSTPQPEFSKKSSAGSYSPDERAQLTLALMQVCQMQHEYGKHGEDFETMVKGFLWVLEDYPMPTILAALKQYLKTKSDIPAPADLVKIIEPPPEPLSTAMYVGLKQRIAEGYYPLSDERAFMRAYESQEMAKVRGNPHFESALKAADGRKGVLMVDGPEWRAQKEKEEQHHLANLEKWRKEFEEKDGATSEESTRLNGLPMDEKVRRTIDAMRAGGAPEGDIQEFLASVGAAA